MPSPTSSERSGSHGLRSADQRTIDRGIEQVVHLPLSPAQRTDLYQGADLSPASRSSADWLENLFPADGIDTFLAASMELPIESRLLLAPVFNGLLDELLVDLDALCCSGHTAGPQVAAALEVLRSQADLRDLLLSNSRALLEA